MATGNSRIYQEGASFTMADDVPSTIVGLKAASCTQPYSMKTQDRWFSIHTAHITMNFN